MQDILKITILLPFFALQFWSCNSKQNKPIENNNLKDSVNIEDKVIENTTSTGSTGVILTVSSNVCKMYQETNPSSKELGRFIQGEVLTYLDEITTFTTPMRIQSIDYDEPWVKAKASDGTIGWVYAGNIRFNGISDLKLAEMVFDRRLYKFYGEELTTKIKVYQKEMSDLKTLPAFRMLYQRSEDLRASIDAKVNELLALSHRDSLPDFFWMNEAFPGFLMHLVKNGTEYRLFRDYRYWAKLAKQTVEPADDVFINVFLLAYQSDSIEYIHQDWRLALNEEETYSLLGRGIHKAVLDRVEEALTNSKDFEPELSKLKQQLLDDISLSTDYWLNKESILTELDEILDHKYSILEKADIIELQARRKMLADPDKFDLRTNLFEGGE